jgi:LmbE family N-acetylglucosaminyl deacetylase
MSGRRRRVMVLSPHPDDESIGCGGTIRKHVEEGNLVNVAFLTSGEKGGHGRRECDTIHTREREARTACSILGVDEVAFLHQPDGAVRRTSVAVEQVAARIAAWRPDLIYVPHDHEMHPDHRAAVRLLGKALECPTPRQHRPRVLMFEVWTPLQRMDEIVDISPFVAVKRKAIRAYRSQCAVMDFDVAALALNRYRGEMHSWPGGDYAEVFAELRS